MIRGIIPTASVNIAVGDSGLGKSPLFYDMAIRVAAGLPFLNCPVRQGNVLIVDFENDEGRVKLCETLARTAGLPGVPTPPAFSFDPEPGMFFWEKIDEHRPSLVIIDSLKMFSPGALKPDGVEALQMLKDLQSRARKYSTAFILIHHLRKEDRKTKLADLATTPALEWLQEAAGSRSFINQTDARIGIAKARGKSFGEGREVLVLKHFVKLRGECGPFYVERMYSDGEPIGYHRLIGVELLQENHRAWFGMLPLRFGYSEGAKLIGKDHSGGTYDNFLKRCEGCGVLEKDFQGYHKLGG